MNFPWLYPEMQNALRRSATCDFRPLQECVSLCPVTVVNDYLAATRDIRDDDSPLLLSLSNPRARTSAQLLSKWVRDTIRAAYRWTWSPRRLITPRPPPEDRPGTSSMVMTCPVQFQGNTQGGSWPKRLQYVRGWIGIGQPLDGRPRSWYRVPFAGAWGEQPGPIQTSAWNTGVGGFALPLQGFAIPRRGPGCGLVDGTDTCVKHHIRHLDLDGHLDLDDPVPDQRCSLPTSGTKIGDKCGPHTL